MKNSRKNRILGFLHTLYIKLFKINDTPQRVALGLGLGVATGILPGTGPIAAIFLALLLRVNRASAIIGSLLTNTWLSFVSFFLALKIGSVIMGVDLQLLRDNWLNFIHNFHWLDLFKASALRIILPAIIGYTVVALGLGIVVYVIAWIILHINQEEKK
ncbi:MAG: DUF2062 domain-containing protein [Candidatus Omnitrophica bacterium]|nr:DUF2062 domain-containing protein [Candidatus Omnitrophota bacterium]